jgi:hypothetical protein
MPAIKRFRRSKRAIVGSFSRAPPRAYIGQTFQHIGLLGAACPARCIARLAHAAWRITVLRPAGTETDSLRRSSGSGISCFVSPAPIRFVAGRQIETAIERIPSGHPPPNGGVGIKLIVRIERNTPGMVSAAPSRKLTIVACLFSYPRLHEISSGQITEKSLKEILVDTASYHK